MIAHVRRIRKAIVYSVRLNCDIVFRYVYGTYKCKIKRKYKNAKK